MWSIPLGSHKEVRAETPTNSRRPSHDRPIARRSLSNQGPGEGAATDPSTTTQPKHAPTRVVNDFLTSEDGVSMAQRRSAVLSAQLLLKNMSSKEFARLQGKWSGKAGARLNADEFFTILKPLIVSGGLFDSKGTRVFGSDDEDEDGGNTAPSQLQCRKRRSDLDNYIHDLFITIDAPRHGSISWDEFITFVIDDVMKSQSTSFNRSHDDPQYVFRGDCTVRDPAIRVSMTDTREWYSKLYYYENWDRVVAVWRNKVFITPPTSLNSTLHQHNMCAEHKSDVFCCEYIHHMNVILTATRSTKPICIWSPGTNIMMLKKQLEFDIPVTEDEAWINVMRYTSRLTNDKSGVVLCATRAGVLHQVDLRNKHNVWSLKTLSSTPVHKGSMTDVLVLPANGNVVTCGADGKVCILNTFHDSRAVITELVGHKRGVYSMSYSPEYNYIVSGGYEGFAFCWVANMGTTPAFMLEDTSSPNQFPLVSVKCLPNSPHVVTLDNRGTYKLFDVRTVRILESWRLTDEVDPGHYGSNPVQGNECIAAFCYTGSSHRQLVCGGRRIYIHDHHAKATESPRLAHNTKETIVAAAYCESSNDFVTATAQYVTVWSGLTGSPKCSHTNLSTVPITKIVVDGAAGKFLLGLQNGDVTSHVLQTGVQMRRYVRHDRPISSIVVDSHNSLLFTASHDGFMCVWHDDDSATEKKLMNLQSVIGGAFGDPRPTAVDIKQMFSTKKNTTANVDVMGSKFLKGLSKPRVSRGGSLMDGAHSNAPPQAEEVSTVVTMPACRVQLEQNIRQILVQARIGVFAIIPTKDCFCVYTLAAFPKVQRTHRVALLNSEEIVTACFIADLPQLCLVDSTGMLQLWELGAKEDEATQIRKWFNYSPWWTPHVLDKREISHVLDNNVLPSRIVPTINCITYDPVKKLLITGDDRGWVILWDVTTAWMQYTTKGVPARIHAFEVHTHPIISLQVIAAPIHCVLTAAANNSVYLCLLDGCTLAALRQGPLVERYWNFTNHVEEVKRCNARLRWYAFRNLGAQMALSRRNPDQCVRAFISGKKTSVSDDAVDPRLSDDHRPSVGADIVISPKSQRITFAELRKIMDRKAVPKVIFHKDNDGPIAQMPKYRSAEDFKKDLYDRAEETHVKVLELGTSYKDLRGFQDMLEEQQALHGPQGDHALAEGTPEQVSPKAPLRRRTKKPKAATSPRPVAKKEMDPSSLVRGVCMGPYGSVITVPVNRSPDRQRSQSELKIRKPDLLEQEVPGPSTTPDQLRVTIMRRNITSPPDRERSFVVKTVSMAQSETLHHLSSIKKLPIEPRPDMTHSIPVDLARILQLCEDNTPLKRMELRNENPEMNKTLESVLSCGVPKKVGGPGVAPGGALRAPPEVGKGRKPPTLTDVTLPKLFLHGSNAPETTLSGYRKVMM